MKKEKIKTISGEELMKLDIPPMKYIVSSLIPQGMHVVSGPSKIGKSWLLLLLCLKVAKGERFWNLRTEKGTVLYLCLEDGLRRIQDRLSEFTEDAPDNLYFATSAPSLAEDLASQIENFITEHPDTVMIVIDTLQKIREGCGEANAYADDYKDIGNLKSIADKNNIALMVVHHVRKQWSDDPHQMVIGTTGIIGAADTSYVLMKEKITDDVAKFYVRGRDVEEQVLTIKFNPESKEWVFVSSNSPIADAMKNDKVISLLINFIKKQMEFIGTASELAITLGGETKANVLTRRLSRYKNELADMGITFEKSRSGERRELKINYKPDDDMTVMTDS